MRADQDKTTLWLKLANAPEGEREHALGLMLRQRGLPWVCAHVTCAASDVEAWCAAGTVPAQWSEAVRSAYRSHLAIECRAGRGKIDVERAQQMRNAGMDGVAIAAEFGVTHQAVYAVTVAPERRSRKRDALVCEVRVERPVPVATEAVESDAA